MNTLMIPSWYYDTTNPTSGIFFKEQTQALSRLKGLEIGLMYGKFDWRESIRSEIAVDREDGFLTVRGKAWAPPKVTRLGIETWLHRYTALFEHYKQLAGMPTMIHAHSWVAGLVAERLKKRYGIPYILTEHLSRINDGNLTARQYRLARKAYGGAAHITAVSQGLADRMRGLTGGKGISVLPNSVDTGLFDCGETAELQKPLVLLSIGRPWQRKGHDLLLRAAVQLRRLGLDIQVWIGGVTTAEASIANDIQKELGSNFKILGMMSRDAVSKAMCESSIYVSASSVEPFGVTIIEALSCGIPVAASRTAGGRAIIEGKKHLGEAFDIGDVDQMVEVLQYMVAYRSLYDRRIIRKHVVDHYSQTVIANKAAQFYRKVLEE